MVVGNNESIGFNHKSSLIAEFINYCVSTLKAVLFGIIRIVFCNKCVIGSVITKGSRNAVCENKIARKGVGYFVALGIRKSRNTVLNNVVENNLGTHWGSEADSAVGQYNGKLVAPIIGCSISYRSARANAVNEVVVCCVYSGLLNGGNTAYRALLTVGKTCLGTGSSLTFYSNLGVAECGDFLGVAVLTRTGVSLYTLLSTGSGGSYLGAILVGMFAKESFNCINNVTGCD